MKVTVITIVVWCAWEIPKRLVGESDPLRIVQEIKIWPNKQVVYTQSGIYHGEWKAHSSLGFWDTNGLPNPGHTNKPSNNQQKKKKKEKKREPAE